MAVNKHGDVIATGSEDSSIRLWNVTHADQHHRKLKLLCSFCGHFGAVRCLEISSEFSLLVSGGADGNVIVWNYRTKRMVKMLSRHSGPILSLSLSAISGQIVTLTADQLRLYTVNGELLSYVTLSEEMDEDIGSRTRGGSVTVAAVSSAPKVVVASPAAEWQDGVVAVTGHAGGHVYLWRLRSLATEQWVSRDLPQSADESRDASSGTHLKWSPSHRRTADSPTHSSSNGSRLLTRQLYISASLTKVHRSDITVLRLCSAAATLGNSGHHHKDLVTRCFDDSRSIDLLVGDADGCVSRWAPLRLDQLPNSDLQSLVLDSAHSITGQEWKK